MCSFAVFFPSHETLFFRNNKMLQLHWWAGKKEPARENCPIAIVVEKGGQQCIEA